MMEWIDKSDSKSRFFVSECDSGIEGAEFIAFISELLLFVSRTVIGDLHPIKYDKLFLEVNCDTGRVIIASSTDEGRTRGHLDGCAVTLPRLQDFWYDLDESGVSGEKFSESVRNEILRIGKQFGAGIEAHAEVFLSHSSQSSIELVVFGSEPKEVIFRKEFRKAASH